MLISLHCWILPRAVTNSQKAFLHLNNSTQISCMWCQDGSQKGSPMFVVCRTFHAFSKPLSIDFFWNHCCGPKWDGAICLLRKPENKCWSVVYLTCCLDFKAIWKEAGVCRTVCSGAESCADTSCGQSWPSQGAASSTVYEPWRPYGFISLRWFFS